MSANEEELATDGEAEEIMTDGEAEEMTTDGEAGTAAATAAVSDEDAIELLVDLVSTPSVSGEEDAAAAHLVEFFQSHGREAWLDDVGNVRAPGDDSLLLTSHIDTVPGEIPVELQENEDGEDVLWGRGSVDATGSLAAMAVAAVETGVSFVGVVGEETDSRGAHHLVGDRDEPGAVVNGEPSGWDAIALGYRGFLAGTYTVRTESTHSSRPEANALEVAMEWWTRVSQSFPLAEGVFEQVTAKVVGMAGGLTDDGTAMEATLDVQFRLPPGTDAETVTDVAAPVAAEGAIDWQEPIPPWLASYRTSLATAFRKAIRQAGGDPGMLKKTGTCDANIYAGRWDCPIVTYGPGDSALDHAPDERLALPEYVQAIEILEAVATEVSQ